MKPELREHLESDLPRLERELEMDRNAVDEYRERAQEAADELVGLQQRICQAVALIQQIKEQL